MDQAPRDVPHSWLDALERGRADIAAGGVSELEPFLRALEAEDEAELAAERSRDAGLVAEE